MATRTSRRSDRRESSRASCIPCDLRAEERDLATPVYTCYSDGNGDVLTRWTSQTSSPSDSDGDGDRDCDRDRFPAERSFGRPGDVRAS
jgi:hypothetical protein